MEKRFNTLEEIKKYIADNVPNDVDVLVFDNTLGSAYEKAFVGLSSRETYRALYDYELMVEQLASEYSDIGVNKEDAYEEAVEWIEYNTIRALSYYPKYNRPIILYPIEYIENWIEENFDEEKFKNLYNISSIEEFNNLDREEKNYIYTTENEIDN